MTRASVLAAMCGAVMLSAAADAAAQGLADVARKEAARRDHVPAAGKTYTNRDLTPDFTTPQPPSAAAPASEEATTKTEVEKPADGPAAGAAAGEAAPEDQDGVTPRDQQEPQPEDDKDETFWRNQSKLIRSRLANQNAQILQLRARLSAFEVGSTDTELRVVEKTLEHAISDLAFLNEEWVRFERQARERKIPESWIR